MYPDKRLKTIIEDIETNYKNKPNFKDLLVAPDSTLGDCKK
jgi:hypothetical protein